MQSTPVEVLATDKFKLSATLFHSPNIIQFLDEPPSPQGYNCTNMIVLINCATGVSQTFYYALAKHLVSRSTVISQTNANDTKFNIRVITWDYRGSGKSLPPSGSISNFKANIEDWARKDLPSIMEFAKQQQEELSCQVQLDFEKKHGVLPRIKQELIVIGHSVGFHILGLTFPELNARITRIVSVSGNSAFLAYLKSITTSLYFFYVLAPLLNLLYGYAAFSKVGLMEDVPTGVAAQWAQFSNYRAYFVNEQGETIHHASRDSVKAPILSISFEDDDFAKKIAFDEMHAKFKYAQRIVRYHFSRVKMGHNNFFRQSNQWWWDTFLVPYVFHETFVLKPLTQVTEQSIINYTSNEQSVPLLESLGHSDEKKMNEQQLSELKHVHVVASEIVNLVPQGEIVSKL